VASGVDTIVHQPATVGVKNTDSVNVAVPRFVQYSGWCGDYGAAAAAQSSLAASMRNNFGVDCQGLRQPFSANGTNTANAKLQYTYGTGSRVALSGLYSLNDVRNLSLSDLYNPTNYTGTTNTSYAGILNWTQNLSRSAERAMALDVNVSYQLDKSITAPLTRQSELDGRDPFGGFLLKPFDYAVDFNSRHSVKIGDSTYQNVGYLDDKQVQCVLAGEGFCQNDVPLLNDNDLNSVMPYRLNPYGVEQSNRFSMWTAGQDQGINLSQERRLQARANFDWQADRFNRIKLGGEIHSFDTRRYADGSGMNSSFGLNAYHEKPIRWGGYIEDRLDLGDVVIVGGLRYDWYDSRAMFPLTPGRVSSLPATVPGAHACRCRSRSPRTRTSGCPTLIRSRPRITTCCSEERGRTWSTPTRTKCTDVTSISERRSSLSSGSDTHLVRIWCWTSPPTTKTNCRTCPGVSSSCPIRPR